MATLVTVAEKYLDTQEIPRGSNCGPMVDKFKAAVSDATGLNPHADWPWCAAYVSFCVQELAATHPELTHLQPHLAGAWAFESWAEAHGCLVFSPGSIRYRPQAGDIVTFTFSHIGIVTGAAHGVIQTIEGNSNDEGSRDGHEVCRKDRGLSVCRKFIRLPVLPA